MQVIAFMNMKGGVGKTTLAVNVAYGLAELHKQKVLIVDVDPQFNATQYFLDDDVYLQHLQNDKSGTSRDIFVPRRQGAVKTVRGLATPVNRTKMSLNDCTCEIFDAGKGRGRLDLIPSTLALMDLEMSRRGTEQRLGAYLREKAQGYDYVIIDCPPTISIFTQAAILASDKYLVPIKPDPISAIGLPLLERWLDDYADEQGIEIKSAGLVFSMVRGPAPLRMKSIMDELRTKRPKEVFANFLSESTHVAEAVEVHLPVYRYNNRGRTAQQVVSITDEFLKRTSGG